MPVTVYPAPHAARAFERDGGYGPARYFDTNSRDLMDAACESEAKRCKEVLQDSFGDLSQKHVSGSKNGFVKAAIEAYSSHYHLVIRPDDVWISIMSQFSLYVNAHAEELRSTFVSHEGKKQLIVHQLGTRHTVDFGDMANEFTEQMKEHINDPSLRVWIIQDFSTTTPTDRIVTAISMMGTLQAYFDYYDCIDCGLPSVTLLGERDDWMKLRSALDRLHSFGKETSEWADVLHVVISRFIASFDKPDSAATKRFWQQIAHYNAGDSGPSYWSGWITAFCFWDAYGENAREQWRGERSDDEEVLTIHNQVFHRIESDNVPPGWVTVPVTVDDNGQVFSARMVAGAVGINVSSSGKTLEKGGTGLDTVQPEVGWWMFEEAEPEEVNETFAGRRY